MWLAGRAGSFDRGREPFAFSLEPMPSCALFFHTLNCIRTMSMDRTMGLLSAASELGKSAQYWGRAGQGQGQN